MMEVTNDDDIELFQSNLEKIYNWAGTNHMKWNDTKFQLLRFGPNLNIKESTYIFSPGMEGVIEDKEQVKDLGIIVDNELRYKSQMDCALNKANKKANWVFRTFKTRDVIFLKKIWKSTIQCHLDYGSILWAPVSEIMDLKKMENVLRSYTRRAIGMDGLNYWERLKKFKLYSQQRRNERYKII